MDNIFGSKQNVVPSYQLGNSTDEEDDEDNEDNEDDEEEIDDGNDEFEELNQKSNPKVGSTDQDSITSNITVSVVSEPRPTESNRKLAAKRKINEITNNESDTKKKPESFAATYAKTQQLNLSHQAEVLNFEKVKFAKEMKLNKLKLNLDTSKQDKVLADDKEFKNSSLKSDSKTKITMALIEQGKSPNTIKKYLTTLADDLF